MNVIYRNQAQGAKRRTPDFGGVRQKKEFIMEIGSATLTKKETGFVLRPATWDDLEPVVEMINAAGVDQVGRAITNTREVEADWNIPSFNLENSARVAEAGDGRIAGYVEVWDTEAIPVKNWVWARVDPAQEGLGIGTALMNWADVRLQETLERTPADTRVVYHSAALSSHQPSIELFRSRGMAFVRRFWHMMRTLDGPLPQAQLPQGITLATFAERPDLRAVALANDEAFQDHWGYVHQPQEEMIREFKEWIDSKPDFDPQLWFLAMDGEEIAGICLCSRKRHEYPGAAWVNSLGVRQPWRRKGIGLAMLHHAFTFFQQEGEEKVGLGVDSSSLTGATELYEKAGMSVVKQDDAYEKVIRPGRDLSKK